MTVANPKESPDRKKGGQENYGTPGPVGSPLELQNKLRLESTLSIVAPARLKEMIKLQGWRNQAN